MPNNKKGIILIIILLLVSVYTFQILFLGSSQTNQNSTINETNQEIDRTDENENIIMWSKYNTTQMNKTIVNYITAFQTPNKSLVPYVHPNSPNYQEITLNTQNSTEDEFVRRAREDIIMRNISINPVERYENGTFVLRVSVRQSYQSIENQNNYGVDVSSQITDDVYMRKNNGKWLIWSLDRLIE